MKLIDYYESIDLISINKFVEDGEAESINLEFKTVNHPERNDEAINSDKKNYSKTLSGFANSSGGIIIWGIYAKGNSKKQDVAKELKPIKELTSFFNSLNKLEGMVVTPTINGIKHEKIELNNDEGFIKTFVPASETGPHMALNAGKYYYKRNGDSFYQCEHFDIVDMFSRKSSPSLKFTAKVFEPIRIPYQEKHTALISIENIGRGIAKFPALFINTPQLFRPYEYGMDGSRGTGLPRIKKNVDYMFNYIGGTENVIFPNSKLDVDLICIQKNRDKCPDLNIEYIIYAENMESQSGNFTIKGSEFDALWS